jgi:long-chain acyl-CoA synthetase
MNVADLVRDAADAYPAKPAIVFQGRSITFGEMDERVDLAAAALAGLGVGKGDRVALLAGNVPEFPYALYGTMRAGGVTCPLNVMLTPEEIAYILADARASAVITDLNSLPGLLSVRDRLADLHTVVVIGGPPAPPGTVSFEEIVSAGADPPVIQTDQGDLAVIAYTAGTTAAPKGAMLTHGNLAANIDQMMAVPALAEAEDDVALLALPLFHIYAMNVILGLGIRTGATAVLVERFDPAETLALVDREKVTVLFGAPPMFAGWLAVADAGPVPDVSSIRLAVSGAAPLPGDVLERFRERFGVTIWEGYGLTESSPAVTTNALGEEAKPNSIGLPLPGLEVRLVDDHGEDVEEGDPGEIWVRGPNVFTGYWNRPEETSAVLTDGWLRTGDVAYRDEDGYLFIVDRKKDLIIVSGFNVFPKEVEEALQRHPAVAEAAVVGIADERTGEAVQAWVMPEEGRTVSPQELQDFLHGYLARFKVPKDIQVVEELPHHVTGKVLRRVLREQGDTAPSAAE